MTKVYQCVDMQVLGTGSGLRKMQTRLNSPRVCLCAYLFIWLFAYLFVCIFAYV